ncbi:hypothetical protein [Aphanothece sacrum]|uniref:Helicase associated domain-containing protein n=1 Tax=Aphanothece sacrum FPU1 TaxID=1920663 RepID=A0A401IEL5_APHSA|nr:hypothetical protein [Aphanothece sacrum]GBF79713.1 helicase associated domain-containing protein [Aphanothece sacrum FPU1]
MSLPTDFNSWEHFQDIWKKTHNKEVRQWFRDLDPDTLDLDLKNTSTKFIFSFIN